MVSNNAINCNDAGLIRYDGTSVFDSQTTTNHNVLVGATSNGITNVAPSATSGVPVISQGAAADPTFGTAVVAGGGTGNTTFTAYSVIAAGTTATGAFQNISGVGTSGQVLTSNGAGTLPSWQAAGGAGFQMVSGTLTSSQVKNLHGTPIEAIAAPGVGKIISIISSQGKLNYGGTNVFVAGAGQVISAFYGTTPTASAQLLGNTNITASSDQLRLDVAGARAGAVTSYDNIAVNLYNSNVTEISGNAANDNTVDWIITYQILDV